MKKLTMVALAALLCCAGAAFAASRADQAFMTKAIQGDMAEVQMGQLAQQKGGTDAVKSFGRMLVTDHQADQQKAEQVAKQIGATVPTAVSASQKASYDILMKLRGDAFDRRFAAIMVMDHQKDIREYRRVARRTSDPVGRYAKEALPTLEKHLQAAKKLRRGKAASR